VALCPDGQRGSGRDRARLRTGGRPAVRRARRGRRPRRAVHQRGDAPRRRRPGDPRLRSRAVRRAPRDRERGVRHRRRRPVLRLLARPPARRVQGPPQGLAARRLLSGPDRRALREPRRLGPRALLDEHARRVAPRAPVPQHRPQRRVQHDPRERQLDARPRERPRSPGVRCGTRHDQAGDRRSQPIGHRERRQRGRAPLAGRPRPPAHPPDA